MVQRRLQWGPTCQPSCKQTGQAVLTMETVEKRRERELHRAVMRDDRLQERLSLLRPPVLIVSGLREQ
jgi:hypothetical protein